MAGVALAIKVGDWFKHKGHKFISPRLMLVYGEAYGQPISMFVVYSPAHSTKGHAEVREELFLELGKQIKKIPKKYRAWCVIGGGF